MKIVDVEEQFDTKGNIISRRTITSDVDVVVVKKRMKDWADWMRKFLAVVDYIPGDE